MSFTSTRGTAVMGRPAALLSSGKTLIYHEAARPVDRCGFSLLPLKRGLTLLTVLGLAACQSRLASSPSVMPAPPAGAAAASGARGGVSTKIQHVVFIIQENRSFDNLFQGYPGANTVASGKDSNGNTIALTPIPLEVPYDISHGIGDFLNATDGGKMDGFNLELIQGNSTGYPNPEYGYVPPSESKLYFEMAHRYVLADNAFTSHLDASWVSHQYAIAAQAASAVDFPNFFGCEHSSKNLIPTLTQQRQIGPSEPACRNYQTLGDEADAAGLSWRHYSSSKLDWIWEPYGSVRHIRYGPDWKADVLSPETRILSDIQSGNLANIVWVTPSNANSDHSSSLSNSGPAWVASVVNAIGESPFWDSTAIFVMWDEWGGWYDHVPPPYEDFDGLGIRVPLLMISPYAKKDHVSHVQYEMSSVLRFIEDQFGLAQLAASDARATDPAGDCFNFNRAPRAFVPFKTTLGINDFIRADAASHAPPDSE